MRAKARANASSVKRAISSACGSSVMVDASHGPTRLPAAPCTAGSGSLSSRLYAAIRLPRSSSGTGATKPSHRSGIDVGGAALVEPVELAPAEREDAAEHELGDPLGVLLGVGEGER